MQEQTELDSDLVMEILLSLITRIEGLEQANQEIREQLAAKQNLGTAYDVEHSTKLTKPRAPVLQEAPVPAKGVPMPEHVRRIASRLG